MRAQILPTPARIAASRAANNADTGKRCCTTSAPSTQRPTFTKPRSLSIPSPLCCPPPHCPLYSLSPSMVRHIPQPCHSPHCHSPQYSVPSYMLKMSQNTVGAEAGHAQLLHSGTVRLRCRPGNDTHLAAAEQCYMMKTKRSERNAPVRVR